MKNGTRGLLFAAILLTAGGGALLAQTASAPWAGTYEGALKGGRGKATIKGPNGGGYNYEVTLSVAGPGCKGDAYGGGDVKNGVLTAIVPVGNHADGWQECRIAMTREGGNLRITESRACAGLHGASCAFTGTLAPAGVRASAAPKARPLPRDALCPPACSYNSGGLAGTMGEPRPAPAPQKQSADPYAPRWFIRSDFANYGPPEAGAFVTLNCTARGINVALMDVEPDRARRRSILTSGGKRFEWATTVTETSLDFVVPYDQPVLANFAAHGFTVSFVNGEENPFPGHPGLAGFISACRSKQG